MSITGPADGLAPLEELARRWNQAAAPLYQRGGQDEAIARTLDSCALELVDALAAIRGGRR